MWFVPYTCGCVVSRLSDITFDRSNLATHYNLTLYTPACYLVYLYSIRLQLTPKKPVIAAPVDVLANMWFIQWRHTFSSQAFGALKYKILKITSIVRFSDRSS